MVDLLGAVSEGEQVLLVWSDLGHGADQLTGLVTSLQQRVGSRGRYRLFNNTHDQHR
jgi:hypothetical protein